MGDDEDGPALGRLGGQVGDDGRLEVGERADDHVGEALGTGEVRGVHVAVAGIAVRAALVALGQRRRRGGVAAAPHLDLLGPVALSRLLLVAALEVAVVALVEPPRPVDREPQAAHRLEGEVGREDGAGEQ